MITIQQAESFIRGNIKRNSFGVVVVTMTEPRMNKTGNPFLGRVRKMSEIVNIALGRDYYTAVGARLERNGLEIAPTDIQHQAPKGRHHYGEGGFFLQSDKDPDVFYLRLTENKNTTRKVTYLLDGHVASDKELDEIKKFFPSTNYSSSKQSALGLSDADQVKVTDVLLTNVVEIRQGTKILK